MPFVWNSFTQYTLLQVEFDMEGKVCGVTSEGETAKCKKVVCDPSYLSNKVDITVFNRCYASVCICLYQIL